MQITLSEEDREWIAQRCAETLHNKVMYALFSGAGYEHMKEQVSKWVNMYTDESMIKATVADETRAEVGREVKKFFDPYARGEAKEIGDAFRTHMRTFAIKEIASMGAKMHGALFESSDDDHQY